MNDNHKKIATRVRVLEDKVRRIFLEEWNPIGFPVPENEYDSYIGPVIGLIYSGNGSKSIAQYLHQIEISIMGLMPPQSRICLESVAKKLAALKSELEEMEPA